MLKHISAWLTVLVAMAGISAALVAYKRQEFSSAKAAADASPEPVEAVSSVRARTGTWSASTRAIGTVVAKKQLELRNELAGTIAELGFMSGGLVEPKQVLVKLDVRQEQASLAAAQADVRIAQQTLQRREGLKSSAAFSAQEVDRARAVYEAATARAQP